MLPYKSFVVSRYSRSKTQRNWVGYHWFRRKYHNTNSLPQLSGTVPRSETSYLRRPKRPSPCIKDTCVLLWGHFHQWTCARDFRHGDHIYNHPSREAHLRCGIPGWFHWV